MSRSLPPLPADIDARLAAVRDYAHARVAQCRRDERTLGPLAQGTLEAVAERRALCAVLALLGLPDPPRDATDMHARGEGHAVFALRGAAKLPAGKRARDEEAQ